MQACNLMVEAGKVSSEQRNEVVLVTDVLVSLSCSRLCYKLSLTIVSCRVLSRLWTRSTTSGRPRAQPAQTRRIPPSLVLSSVKA